MIVTKSSGGLANEDVSWLATSLVAINRQCMAEFWVVYINSLFINLIDDNVTQQQVI